MLQRKRSVGQESFYVLHDETFTSLSKPSLKAPVSSYFRRLPVPNARGPGVLMLPACNHSLSSSRPTIAVFGSTWAAVRTGSLYSFPQSTTTRIFIVLVTSLRFSTVSVKSISFPVETRTAVSKVSRRAREIASLPFSTLKILQPVAARHSSTAVQASEQTSSAFSNLYSNLSAAGELI